jgi:hypothetical protein
LKCPERDLPLPSRLRSRCLSPLQRKGRHKDRRSSWRTVRPYGCVPQLGWADPSGQGNCFSRLPSSRDVHSLKGPLSARLLQRKTICLPEGDHAALSARSLIGNTFRPLPSGRIVARREFRRERVLAGHESPEMHQYPKRIRLPPGENVAIPEPGALRGIAYTRCSLPLWTSTAISLVCPGTGARVTLEEDRPGVR